MFYSETTKSFVQHRKLGDRNKLSLGTFVLPLGFTSSYYFFKDGNTYIVVTVELEYYMRCEMGQRQKQKATLKVIVGDILS